MPRCQQRGRTALVRSDLVIRHSNRRGCGDVARVRDRVKIGDLLPDGRECGQRPIRHPLFQPQGWRLRRRHRFLIRRRGYRHRARVTRKARHNRLVGVGRGRVRKAARIKVCLCDRGRCRAGQRATRRDASRRRWRAGHRSNPVIADRDRCRQADIARVRDQIAVGNHLPHGRICARRARLGHRHRRGLHRAQNGDRIGITDRRRTRCRTVARDVHGVAIAARVHIRLRHHACHTQRCAVGASRRRGVRRKVWQRAGKVQRSVIQEQVRQRHIARVLHRKRKRHRLPDCKVRRRWCFRHVHRRGRHRPRHHRRGRGWPHRRQPRLRGQRYRRRIGDLACVHIRLRHRVSTYTTAVRRPWRKRCDVARKVRVKERIRDRDVRQRRVARIAHPQREVHHIARRCERPIRQLGKLIRRIARHSCGRVRIRHRWRTRCRRLRRVYNRARIHIRLRGRVVEHAIRVRRTRRNCRDRAAKACKARVRHHHIGQCLRACVLHPEVIADLLPRPVGLQACHLVQHHRLCRIRRVHRGLPRIRHRCPAARGRRGAGRIHDLACVNIRLPDRVGC